MFTTLIFLPIAIGLWICYFIISRIVQQQQWATRARELGCLPAPRFMADPLGLHFLMDHLKADAGDRMPLFLVQRFYQYSEQLGRPAHTYEMTLPPALFGIYTCEPDNLKAMLSTQFNDFEVPQNRIDGFEPLLGTGIFVSNGSRWEHSRALLRPQFARHQVAEAATEERHIANLLRAVGPVQSDGWTKFVDVQPLFFRMTLDNATEFLFGHSVNCQLSALAEESGLNSEKVRDEEFVAAWDSAQEYLMKATRFGDLYWIAHYSGGLDFFNCCKQVHKFANYYVEMALARHKEQRRSDEQVVSQTSGGRAKYIFLDALAAEIQDPKELRFQLLNMLLAGRDTTSSLLGWVFRELAFNPAVFAKLRARIIEDFGTYANPRAITFETLKACQYLMWVLNETLRVYPVLPFNSRAATIDTTLPTGGGPAGKAPVFVPKGTEVVFSVHVLHHRTDLWGSDASDWKPDRWEKRKPGWEFLPFHGGPRICIGQQYALAEAGYTIVRMLQRFDAIDAGRLEPNGIKHRLKITNSPGDGVNIRFRVARD